MKEMGRADRCSPSSSSPAGSRIIVLSSRMMTRSVVEIGPHAGCKQTGSEKVDRPPDRCRGSSQKDGPMIVVLLCLKAYKSTN
jgi:hypothetical protein